MSPVVTRCKECGSDLVHNARFCSTCGTPTPPPSYVYAPPQPIIGPTRMLGSTTPEERNWAMLCHLASFLGYLFPFGDLIVSVVLWSTKKDQSPFIAAHCKEALNYQISYYIYLVISLALTVVLVGFVMLAALTIFDITVTIIAAIKASNGESYRYPLTIRLVQ